MRELNETVSQWGNGRYFVCVHGNEILLKATSDEEALAEGAQVLAEIEQAEANAEPSIPKQYIVFGGNVLWWDLGLFGAPIKTDGSVAWSDRVCVDRSGFSTEEDYQTAIAAAKAVDKLRFIDV